MGTGVQATMGGWVLEVVVVARVGGGEVMVADGWWCGKDCSQP